MMYCTCCKKRATRLIISNEIYFYVCDDHPVEECPYVIHKVLTKEEMDKIKKEYDRINNNKKEKKEEWVY